MPAWWSQHSYYVFPYFGIVSLAKIQKFIKNTTVYETRDADDPTKRGLKRTRNEPIKLHFRLAWPPIAQIDAVFLSRNVPLWEMPLVLERTARAQDAAP